jgi:hypothetical protein
VDVVNRLRAGRSKIRIPIGKREFSPNVLNDSGAQPAFYSMGAGVQKPDREDDHSPPPSAEVKIEWNYTSTSPIRRDGVYRDVVFIFDLGL